ncbi:MAG: hypothetical protein EZS28_040823 [Streblomastix strix]|uniref:Transmembrane protein n=1 Tax=Streblomastix strix TaxID=222440 RepID=A0A5J4U0F8_9EUKA|nr:MAG: hypothetical protein EZS28_040823 [Streblomastix strix]
MIKKVITVVDVTDVIGRKRKKVSLVELEQQIMEMKMMMKKLFVLIVLMGLGLLFVNCCLCVVVGCCSYKLIFFVAAVVRQTLVIIARKQLNQRSLQALILNVIHY